MFGFQKQLLAALMMALACGFGLRAVVPAAAAGLQSETWLASVYQPPYEQLEAFFIAGDGSVRGVWKGHSSAWRPPFNLTGPGFAQPGAPLAVAYESLNNQVELFVVGNDGTLWDIWKANNGPWSQPLPLSGAGFAPSGAAISAVFQPLNNQLEVFLFDGGGVLRDVWKANNGTWSAPLAVSPPNFGREGQALSAVYNPTAHTLNVFMIDRAGAMRYVWKGNNGPWQQPVTISSDNFAAAGAPLSGVYYPLGKHMEVFVVGTDGILRGAWKPDDGNWKADLTISPPGFASPRAPVSAVYQPRNQQLEVFVVSKAGALWDSWKSQDAGNKWQPPVRLTDDHEHLHDGSPVAAVSQDFNDELDVFGVDQTQANLWSSHKVANGPWRRPVQVSGAYFTPVYMPSDCSLYYRAYQSPVGGYVNESGIVVTVPRDTYLEAYCPWVMGWEQNCGTQNAHVAGGNDQPWLCISNFNPADHPGSIFEQLTDLTTAIGRELYAATISAMPYVGAGLAAVGCVTGAIFACASLALDVITFAGGQLPDVAPEAIRFATQLSTCVDGNIAACAQAAVGGAKAAGVGIPTLVIPGVDPGRLLEDTTRCANEEFAACLRLGLSAADAAGVKVPSGVRVDDARACANGDFAACTRFGVSAADAVGLRPPGGPDAGDIIRVYDCLSAVDTMNQACVSLGKSAAKAAGFPLKDIESGIADSNACSSGDTSACLRLGQKLTGKAIPGGLDSALRCASGANDACFDLGKALISNGVVRDFNRARACQGGDNAACIELGKSVLKRV
ncbi:MAG: hypothetical protein M3021_09240 [Actinomycetota bacterium]|nr:hypothetical protein [Actinomycetota bacterium]